MVTSTALRTMTSASYTFANVENYEAFKEETDAKLDDYYSVTSNDVSAYEQSLQPLENLEKYASYFLAIVLVVGGIILVVLNIFNIRERKYEIGVLAAIGMKKGKIAVQFITELLCITFLSIVIGAGAGAAVSVPVTNKLLEQQVENSTQTEQEQTDNFGRQRGQGPGNMGKQQQRVAIARALSYKPDIILADEPTGNLDGQTQAEIMEIFQKLAHEEDKCVILVTHSKDVAKESDEVLELGKGVM